MAGWYRILTGQPLGVNISFPVQKDHGNGVAADWRGRGLWWA